MWTHNQIANVSQTSHAFAVFLRKSLRSWAFRLPNQKQSDRKKEFVPPLSVRQICTAVENQSEKMENETLAVVYVIFWESGSLFAGSGFVSSPLSLLWNGFYFSSDLRQTLAVGPASTMAQPDVCSSSPGSSERGLYRALLHCFLNYF